MYAATEPAFEYPVLSCITGGLGDTTGAVHPHEVCELSPEALDFAQLLARVQRAIRSGAFTRASGLFQRASAAHKHLGDLAAPGRARAVVLLQAVANAGFVLAMRAQLSGERYSLMHVRAVVLQRARNLGATRVAIYQDDQLLELLRT